MTAESCRKSKTYNQQLLRDNLKLELKYEVNIRFETQIWKSGPDLKMKNLEIRSWIPGLNLEKNCLKPGNGHFLVYFIKSNKRGSLFLLDIQEYAYELYLNISADVVKNETNLL